MGQPPQLPVHKKGSWLFCISQKEIWQQKREDGDNGKMYPC
jgi:hypothetical protein